MISHKKNVSLRFQTIRQSNCTSQVLLTFWISLTAEERSLKTVCWNGIFCNNRKQHANTPRVLLTISFTACRQKGNRPVKGNDFYNFNNFTSFVAQTRPPQQCLDTFTAAGYKHVTILNQSTYCLLFILFF